MHTLLGVGAFIRILSFDALRKSEKWTQWKAKITQKS